MKISKTHKIILLIAGLIGAGIGAMILFSPVAFYAASGIELGENISLLSDIRSAGGVLLVCGTFIISGAFIAKLTFSATVIASLVYLSYGASRIIAISLDGLPALELVVVAGLEITIGLLCVFALTKYRAVQ